MSVIVDELLDSAERHARKILLIDREKSLITFYHLVLPDEDNILVPCLWKNDIQKQIMVAMVRKMARDLGATAVMFMSESWMVEADKLQLSRLEIMDPPSQQPSRIEVVSIIATDGAATRQRLLRIVRNQPGGAIIALESMTLSETGQISGRLIEGIVPPPAASSSPS